MRNHHTGPFEHDRGGAVFFGSQVDGALYFRRIESFAGNLKMDVDGFKYGRNGVCARGAEGN